MAGIYIHIPYCRQACNYCNFHFSTNLSTKNELLKALLKEIEQRKNYLNEESVETIYLGGGTPSLLSIEELRTVLETVSKNFHLSENPEITLEANPDDVTLELALAWKMVGINRLSMGIQSFQDADLQWMNRAHNSEQALAALDFIREAGFTNYSVDLIYGSPNLTQQQWQANLEKVISLQVPHLSCYALTVEPKTVLAHNIKNKRSANINPEKQASHFLIMTQLLTEAGYQHYEISNLALPGFESKHNSAYWKGKPYLGLGPGAHSFNGKSRSWNITNNQLYITGINTGNLVFDTEILSQSNRINEYIMIALRMQEGISLEQLTEIGGPAESSRVLSLTPPWVKQNYVKVNQQAIFLTPAGKLFADGIAASFFRD